MEKKEFEEIENNIDMKLATEISKSYVQEMSKLESTKSQIKIFKIICILFAIIMLICVSFTSTVSLQLIRFLDNVIVTDDETENVAMDTSTGDYSGSAINMYNNGSGNSLNNGNN